MPTVKGFKKIPFILFFSCRQNGKFYDMNDLYPQRDLRRTLCDLRFFFVFWTWLNKVEYGRNEEIGRNPSPRQTNTRLNYLAIPFWTKFFLVRPENHI